MALVNYHLGAVIESIVWVQAPGPGRQVLYRLRGKLGLELDLDWGGQESAHQGEEHKLGGKMSEIDTYDEGELTLSDVKYSMLRL